MSPGEGFVTPEGVPPDAIRVDWEEALVGTNLDHQHAAGRYGLIPAFLAAGIDAARIHLYHDDEHGAYWVVDPLRGFSVVLTDDTESYVGWMEGPWPFVAMFRGPDGAVRTEVDLSLDKLLAQAITWCTDR